MKSRFRSLMTVAVGTTVLGAAAFGQNYSAPPVGTLGAVEGQVSINQQPVSGGSLFALRDGDILETGHGRVEVLLTPGVFLRLGRGSALEMMQVSTTDTRLRLHQGSAIIEANDIHRDSRLGIETGQGVAEIMEAGLYRFDANPPAVQVIQGSAAVMDDRRTVELHNGERAQLDGSLRTSRAWEVNDELAAWSRSRSQAEADASIAAAQYAYDNPNSGYYEPAVSVASSWVWNPWISSYTWIPARRTHVNFYGFSYWSPSVVYRSYPTRYYSAWRPAPAFAPRPVYRNTVVINRTNVYNRPNTVERWNTYSRFDRVRANAAPAPAGNSYRTPSRNEAFRPAPSVERNHEFRGNERASMERGRGGSRR